MKEAIQKAIEGDFVFGHKKGDFTNDYLVKMFVQQKEKVLLSPLFWQALSKAEGWGKCSNPDHGFIGAMAGVKSTDINRLGCPVCGHNPDKIIEPDAWKTEWHRFIDHLAEGKDPELFFKELLNTKQI
jgi:hypothetical protein